MTALRCAILLLTLAACAQSAGEAPLWAQFSNAQPVTILGYESDAMEPFLSRDGSALFFNNSNDPAEQTDLHWAERIDDLRFRYRGRVAGANSTALDGVSTMSAEGRFCFISPRAYDETLATVHCGLWSDEQVNDLALQPDASAHTRGRVVFDVEISAAGDTIVLADGTFRGGPMPASADLRLARWRDGSFRLSDADDALFANLNTDALEYAAALSADALTIAFTRAEGRPPFVRTSVRVATRDDAESGFGAPARIAAISGEIVEGPAFSPDGNALYYHRKTAGRFSIWRVSR